MLHLDPTRPSVAPLLGLSRPVPDPEKCVHERFESQVEATPHAEAVRLGDVSLTYAELNARANRIAHRLQKLGVGRNVLVGISLDRSVDVVAGIYGILKAGGAYVPLDPAYPVQRLQTMARSIQLRFLITDEKHRAPFSTENSLTVLDLQQDAEHLASESASNPGRIATPDDLIYLIFTSGSTGQPKAAGVYHRGFTNLLHWFTTDFEISANDRALLVSSLSFDLTQKNLYATLIRGGSLELYPPGPYDITLLRRLIRECRITLLNCTPSAFYPLVDGASESQLSDLSSLRVVFLGGEPISIPRLEKWLTHPSCRCDVANTYGPTECTDICGAYRLTRDNRHQYSFVPLGRPVYNVQLLIVDPELKPCEAGVAGELLVGGVGVGAGYLNDPQMTAEKFLANRYAGVDGPLVYRTGDQARVLPDGIIEFLGRLDYQVKIRGFRIELHEIENVLNTHAQVKEAIVIVDQDKTAGTDPRLVCFVTLRDGPKPDIAELKSHLHARLPEYMTPSSFRFVDAYPLSPNGKVDRKALRESLASSPANPPIATPAARGSGLEGTVQEIWSSVLKTTAVGLDDNFFDLGGDSLQLADVHAQLQQRLQRTFPITDLFAHTTVRAIATHFSASASAASAAKQAILDRAQRQREAMANRRPLKR